MFHEAEHDFDFVTFLVEGPVGLALFNASGIGRDDGLDTAFGERGDDLVAVIGAVGEPPGRGV
ncbi:MAG: hypothetical protein R3C97_03755 [Geminicoccaceae bacterium]